MTGDGSHMSATPYPRRVAGRATPAGWTLVAGIAAAAVGLGIASTLGSLSDLVFWSVLAVFTALCALTAYMSGRGRDGSVDVLATAVPFALVLFVMFGLGSLYGYTGLDRKPDHPNPLPALILATIGLAAFAIGYHLPIVTRARSVTDRLPGWRPRRAVTAATICTLIGAVGLVGSFRSVEYFAWTQKTVSSTDAESQLGFLGDFLFMGLGMFAILAASTMSRRRAQLVLIAIAVITIALLLPTGRRFYVFTVLATVGFAWHYYISRIRPAHMYALAVFTILVLNPEGQIWRTAYKTIGATGVGDIPAVAGRVVDEMSSMTVADYLDYTIGERFERLNEAATVAALRANVPSTSDYKYGQTFLPIVTWLVPRFIWHDKPTFQYYNEIGHTLGLITPFDFDTTILYSSIGELYLNFGDLGVPLGMLVIGMLSGWLYKALIAGGPNQTAILVYGLLVMPLWSVEEALGPSMAGALRDVVAAMLVLRLCGATPRLIGRSAG
jgi:hypothetical protein